MAEEAEELFELVPNCEINCSSPPEKLEYEDVAVEDVEGLELVVESDSDSMAENRSCINFPSACR